MKNKLFFALIILSLFLSGITLAQENPAQLPAAAESIISKPTEQNKISLDIKGMDVVDVLKMLAARSGMNLAIGKNVSGKVTLFLKDVNIQDAFEIILLANELAYEKKGDIINVMAQRDYESIYGERYTDKTQVKLIQLKYAKSADLSRALSQIKTSVGRIVADDASNTLVLIDLPEKIQEMTDIVKNADLPLKTQVFNLNYAQVEKIGPKIQEALTKNVGSLKIDERTNKIAVTDYPQRLEDIANIISAFDEKTPQVLIDAQIIQLTPSDKFEMGVDWEYWLKKHFDIKASLPINSSSTLLLGTPNTTPTDAGDYKAILDILRTIGDTKVLSSPRVIALNNQEAKIHVGTRDAYITSTTSQAGTGTTISSQSVNFVDTGIQLNVTPTINRDGFVTMKIKPEISDATRVSITSEGQKTDVPIVSTSEVETTVMVKDGVTIIIGGLRKDKREKTVKKIPLLGDIPGVGFFFRSTSDNLTNVELIILLTPHIMSGEAPFTDIAEMKPREGAVAKMVDGDIITQKISSSKPESASGSLVSDSLTLSKYGQLITDRINQIAHQNYPQGKKGKVNLSFTVSREGKLTNEPLVIKATDDALIPFAVKTIKDSSPLPSFPQALAKSEERFSVTLDYQ